MKLPSICQHDLWFNLADPQADIAPDLLAPYGGYICDRCEGLAIRAELIEVLEGFICPVCAQEGWPVCQPNEVQCLHPH